MITIGIPAYNAEKTIEESIKSALAQEYKNKEILVIDDCSTDRTVEIVKKYQHVRLLINEKNIGIGMNLARLMKKAHGEYIVYLCNDDVFTDSRVVGDIAHIFLRQPEVGVITRYFYQFIDGYPGAVNVCRDHNIITSSCNPSGMAFRKDYYYTGSNKIFVEMPSMVAQALKKWKWTNMEYDTIAVRLHPGGNTATKAWYYQGSMYQNWAELGVKDFTFFEGFIQFKNRAPKKLMLEIKESIKANPDHLKNPAFWFYAIIAVLVPGWILRPLSYFYRHRIARRFVKIIRRPEKCVS